MASNNVPGFNPLADYKKWKLLKDLDVNTLASMKWFKAMDKRLFYCTHDERLFARGENDYGQLGIGHRNDVDTPTLVVDFEGQHVVDIAASGDITLALTQHGRVYAWGYNDSKRLEDFPVKFIIRPKHIESLKNIVSIACGVWHSMVLDEDGKMFIWGGNVHGQIGSNSKDTQSHPIQLDMFTTEVITQIQCGACNSMVLADNGDVWAWGLLFEHIYLTPLKLNVSNQKVKQIACGQNALVSLTQQGQIFIHCGNVTTSQSIQPQHIHFTSVVVIDYKKFDWNYDGNLVLANSATHRVYHTSVNEEGNVQFTKSILPLPDVIIANSSIQVSPFKMTVTDSSLSNEDDEIEDHAASLTRAIMDSFDREDKSDLVFHFPGEGKKIHSNRSYLSLLSPYMRTMLEHAWIGKEDIFMTEYSYRVYHSYIKFLYTGSLATLTLPDLIVLYDLAHGHDEGKLKDKCVRLISNLLNVDNCCKLYELSVKYLIGHLQGKVIEFAKQNFAQIPTDSFAQMSPANLKSFKMDTYNN